MRPERNWNGVEAEHDEASPELSKTKRKQQALELQHLGLELSRLSPKELDSLELTGELRAAIDEVQKIKPGGAFKRQIKFIGGLLREIEDVTPIRARLESLRFKGKAAARRHHLLEKWRGRLLAEGDTAVAALMDEAPAIDCQKLRQLVRSAKKEIEQGKAPRTTRMLYRFLGQYLNAP